jgi:hypothetical protein
VQRELLAKEKWDAGLWGERGSEGYTVLVRLRGDGDEEWEAKKKMEECMLGWLEESAERRNWVMPWDSGDYGVFKEQRSGGFERRLRLDCVRGGHV